MTDQGNVNAYEATMKAGVAVAVDIDPAIVGEVAGDGEVWKQYEGAAWMEPVRRALSSWAEETVRDPERSNRPLFKRNRFVTPGQIFMQMAMAEEAMDDDVVGGVYDTSESMALKKISIESEDADQADVWNQIAADLNLDDYLRVIWRELFKNSQYYGIVWWGTKEYTVRGRDMKKADPILPPADPTNPLGPAGPPQVQLPKKGAKRRKKFTVKCPIGIGVLDPMRVVPVDFDMFGNHSLAWIATEQEMTRLVAREPNETDTSIQSDDLVRTLFVGKYVPTEAEKAKLSKEGISHERLILLNPDNVWMGNLTKASYERWARIRMKSIYPLLDMKHQLREMDRAFLLGGINFIVLVKKGTDQHPVTKMSEVTMVADQMRAQAKSSLIISDHRLEIEIITPDITHILAGEKWAVLDDRIRLRLWGSIAPPGQTGNSESQITLAKVVALGIENRRHMLKRDIEAHIFKETGERNKGTFDEPTSLEYSPRRADLLFDSAVAALFQQLRDRGELSRETILDEFGFDQNLEAQRRTHEKESGLDDIFVATNVPYDSPNKTTPGGSGGFGKKPGDQKPGSDPKPAPPKTSESAEAD